MDHSKLPTPKLTNKLVADFQTELDRYTNMTSSQVKKITVDDAINLAKLGHGIPVDMISGQKACRGLLRKFLDVGGPYQLREYIHCEKYIRFMTGSGPTN
jgi:hypothetical protein